MNDECNDLTTLCFFIFVFKDTFFLALLGNKNDQFFLE